MRYSPSASAQSVKRIFSASVRAMLGVVLVAALGACDDSTGPKHPDTQTTPGKIQASHPGQSVFLNNCVSCHMGGGNPPGPNGIITGSKKLSSLKTLIGYVRQPDNNMMPAISASQVSDAELSDLYAYLKSVTGN